MLLRKKLHNIASKLLGGFYCFLCRLHICNPKVITYIDGGICSQMYQYLTGQVYAIKGYEVGYDLQWFESCGMDVDGRFSRLFELSNMFPNLQLTTYNKRTTWFYRMFLRYKFENEQKISSKTLPKNPPVYLGGYYGMDIEDFRNLFHEIFIHKNKLILPKLNIKIGQRSCAIHVRRGDLANGDNKFYGSVTEQYFFNAIDYVEEHYPKTKYFFFSDEIEYVEKKIEPYLRVEYELICGPHKAYEDLLLIAACDTIIASQGTFGKMAAMLNPASTLIMQSDEVNGHSDVQKHEWLERKGIDKVVLIRG